MSTRLIFGLSHVGVDKMLLYSSHTQTTCARKHNEPSRDSNLAATLACAFSLTDNMNHEACIGHHSQFNKCIIINQMNQKSQQTIEIVAI